MDLEQIVKRLEWLDDERRKDRTTIATLEKRIEVYETSVPIIREQVKQLDGEVTRVGAMLDRFDQVDSALSNLRVEITRKIEGVEKQRQERDRELDKIRRDDLEAFNRAVAEVRKTTEVLPELKTKLNARVEEEYRLNRLIEDVEQKIDDNIRADEEFRRGQKILQEGRRQDTKRLTDLQAEVSAFRKRLEEQRGKVELYTENVRKLELRLGEIQGAEAERRQIQTAFIEKQNMVNLERERAWKEWQNQFEVISGQAVDLESQMQTLDTTHRAVKRAQESFEEVKQRFDRRLNEITEMQRLVEERFRQEWVSFKADDQKRWTNYTLTQEEQQREVTRKIEKQNDRVVQLDDLTRDIEDLIKQITDENQKRLQSLLELTHRWMEDFDNSFGQQR